MHAFQGRTVDNVIAAMEANHPNLTSAKAFYVEISRARDRAELVTDDAAALKERLEAVTGERISALEGIGESVQREHGKDARTALDKERREAGSTVPSSPDREIGRESPERKAPEPEPRLRASGSRWTWDFRRRLRRHGSRPATEAAEHGMERGQSRDLAETVTEETCDGSEATGRFKGHGCAD